MRCPLNRGKVEPAQQHRRSYEEKTTRNGNCAACSSCFIGQPDRLGEGKFPPKTCLKLLGHDEGIGKLHTIKESEGLQATNNADHTIATTAVQQLQSHIRKACHTKTRPNHRKIAFSRLISPPTHEKKVVTRSGAGSVNANTATASTPGCTDLGRLQVQTPLTAHALESLL